MDQILITLLLWPNKYFICCMFRIVEYASYEDMRCAMRKLDGTELNGRKLRLIEDYRARRKRFVIEGVHVYFESTLVVMLL